MPDEQQPSAKNQGVSKRAGTDDSRFCMTRELLAAVLALLFAGFTFQASVLGLRAAHH